MAKTLLMLGGTGAMGSHVVQLLHGNKDYEITITSRSNHESESNIRYVKGNALDKEFIENFLKGKHFNTIIDFMIYPSAVFEPRVNLLLDSCDQYIFLSTSRVYSNNDSVITENTPRLLDVIDDKDFLATDEYALRKAREENILFKSCKKNFTIIRPYITYSEKRLQLGVMEKECWLYRALKGRTIVFSKDISDRFTTLTYGHDVAKGIISLIGQSKALGQVFHITCNNPIRWEDVLIIYIKTLKSKLGKQPKIKMIDLNPRTWMHGSNKYQEIYDRYYDRRFDNSKISHFIDNSTFTIPQEGLAKCLEAFIDNPAFLGHNWKYEAYYDRLCHEHASLSEMATFKSKIKYILYRYFIPISLF